MEKQEYIEFVNERLEGKSKKIFLDQIERYYDIQDNCVLEKHPYKVGDDVYLRKGTLLHGTFRDLEGLKAIAKDGLIAGWFVNGRAGKYPSAVGVWNLQKDYFLKDYINFYSGGTIKIQKLDGSGEYTTEVIPLNELGKEADMIVHKGLYKWYIEQTKEARFMPSLVQDQVQIGIIMNDNYRYADELLKGDILNGSISDKDIKPFIKEDYYEQFLEDRKHPDAFFTDRESAILFGIPGNLIEGVLVGREYEKAILDGSASKELNEIKELLPNAYICNLDGKVIVE